MNTLKLLLASLILSAPLIAADEVIDFRVVVPSGTKDAVEKKNDESTLWVASKPSFATADIKSSFVRRSSDHWVVFLSFTDDAAKRFGDFSKSHIGDRIAILSHGKLISAPTLLQAITGGAVEISGKFTEDTARELGAAIAAAITKTSKP
ncbi:MAG: SecDF P1 head subdomain-containing protein [Verrucomicrobiota bacterium]